MNPTLTYLNLKLPVLRELLLTDIIWKWSFNSLISKWLIGTLISINNWSEFLISFFVCLTIKITILRIIISIFVLTCMLFLILCQDFFSKIICFNKSCLIFIDFIYFLFIHLVHKLCKLLFDFDENRELTHSHRATGVDQIQ